MPASPRYDESLGRYVWEEPAPIVVPVPEFLKIPLAIADFAEAIVPDDESDEPEIPETVMTYADARGVNATPPDVEDFDALADWRTEPEVAEEILDSLPENTPKFIRALLTLLFGGRGV